MNYFALIVAAGFLIMPFSAKAKQPCALAADPTATAGRLKDLPPEIVEQINVLSKSSVGDFDSILLQTDAPTKAEAGFPSVRLHRGILLQDIWYVQLEVAMTSGVLTVSFARDQDNRFALRKSPFFGGPACESINAAVAGVGTPGGFRIPGP